MKLNGTRLKNIAMVIMLIDHFANSILRGLYINNISTAWFDHNTLYLWLIVMRTIGRIAFPIYCFLVAEGVHHSHNLKRYAISLWIFAFISEIPFDLAASGTLIALGDQNIYFTLALAVTAYYLAQYFSSAWKKGLILISAPFIAWTLKIDYGAIGILALYGFMFGNFQIQITTGMALLFYGTFRLCGIGIIPGMLGGILSEIYVSLIRAYDGTRGKIRGNKYLYYAFYPVHLLVLGIIRMIFLG